MLTCSILLSEEENRCKEGSKPVSVSPSLGDYCVLLNRVVSALILTLFILPIIGLLVPVQAQNSNHAEEGWWSHTTIDRNGDGIGDMVELHMFNPIFLDQENTLPLIIDYDHTPSDEEIRILEIAVDYQHQWELPQIDALAGRVPLKNILDLIEIPGVVMIELDGILEVSNADAAEGHGVIDAREETGYDGSGTTVAIIDTGIDAKHASLDDLDDDGWSDDPKVIAFYDVTNETNAGITNGTTEAYDDHGHGSHCAGTTAGTGAPNYEYVGMAPGAKLVGVKVLDAGGSGSFSGVMAGMQWTIDLRYEFNIRAASMSLGGPGAIEWTSSEEDSVNRMANEMVRSGIALFIAAGNNAVSAQIGTPGSAEDVITVGALDKDTSIAIYSSQGPTEEGRIKPNIAYMGSDIMSVEANSGDGYTGMSGTSMATPGAAGVAALMFQANPELSPFDVRNIMQETATYRQCHYMTSNEPCAEDLVPKNRQNNVYGHGHVNALESVLEAAEESYTLNKNLTLELQTLSSDNNRIPLGPGDEITFTLSQGVDTVQWRSNHLRDDWSNLHSYEHTTTVTLDYVTVKHQLEHLPGKTLEGNHTLSMRAIEGDSSSPLITFDIVLKDTGTSDEPPPDSSRALVIGITSIVILALVSILLIGIVQEKKEAEQLRINSSEKDYVDAIFDTDDDSVVEAELVE